MTPETRDEMTDFSPRFAQALSRVDHEIRAAALFAVTHLSGEDRRKLLMAHSRPRQHAAALHMRGCGHHDGGVDMRVAAAFEEKGDIERDDCRAVLPRLGQKRLLRLPHQRMHDFFQAAAGFGVAEHRGTKFWAIDALGSGRAGERRLDRFDRSAAGALQPVHLCISVEHGHARASQHCRDRRLPHAD
ncbi:hypothetical protein DFR51_3500 [Sphingosinicella microcystinivorans]|uniref:HEAT repeat domain-containing protein n=1 Tax=Sphingosinicella microcystinivorans TaxID=335406 RepID=A0ABX9SV75_SPHMI|nr:hypothetical protein DFR51_3500 [Sphingosinicella microcystinivorans]